MKKFRSKNIHKLWDEIDRLEEDNDHLNRLFDLQHSRMREVDKLWQRATGEKNTWPDLGQAITWLLLELKRYKEMCK